MACRAYLMVKMRRARAGLVLVFLSGIVLGSFLLSPLWLPVVVGWLAASRGLTWEAIEAKGYHHWRVEGVRLEIPGMEVRLDTLQIPQPFHWMRSLVGFEGPLEVNGGTLRLELQEQAVEGEANASGPGQLESLRQVHQAELAWLPRLSFSELLFLGTDGKPHLHLRALDWEGQAVSGELLPPAGMPPVTFRVWLGGGLFRLAGLAGSGEDSLRLAAGLTVLPLGAVLEASLESGGQSLFLKSAVAVDRWRLEKLEAEALDWLIPRFIVSGLEGAPVRMDLRAAGDADGIEVERLSLRSEWLEGELSRPLVFNLEERRFSGRALFFLTADLAGQTRYPVKGTLGVELSVDPRPRQWQAMRFSLTAKELLFQDVLLGQVSLSGTFDYPDLAIEAGRIDLPEQGFVAFSGQGSLETGQLAGAGDYYLSQALLGRYLPEVPLTSAVQGQFSVSGPLSDLAHAGAMEPVTLDLAGWHTLGLGLRWTGRQLREGRLEADLRSGPGGHLKLAATVAREREAAGLTLSIEEARLYDGEAEILLLEAPVQARVNPGGPLPVEWLSPLALQSPGGRRLSAELDVAGGRLRLEGHGLSTEDLRPWLRETLPPILLDYLKIETETLHPFLSGQFSLGLSSQPLDLDALGLNLTGRFDADGLRVNLVQGTLAGRPFLEGTLSLPIRLQLPRDQTERAYAVLPEGRLGGELVARMSPELATQLRAFPDLASLVGGRLDLSLGGRLDQPQGTVALSLPELPLLSRLDARLEGLSLRHLELVGQLDTSGLVIESLKARIGDGQVEFSGSYPENPWTILRHEGETILPRILEAARWEARFRGLRPAHFRGFLPAYLRSTGEISGTLAQEPGPLFSGQMEVRGLSLRPTLYSQTVENLDLSLDLEGARLVLSAGTATLGKEEVRMSGFLDLADPRDPHYYLSLTGNRLPLVRTPDLLLRAGVDLSLEKEKGQSAVLSGQVELGDSVFLMDIDPLAARTAGSELARPPFFSVEQSPFAQWRLDVGISGQEALRFRSQYAKALLSANLRLEGSLGSPLLVGNVSSSEGQIQFPGARLSLSRSELYVTRDQSDQMKLDINAIGRVASTIISLRVGGRLEDPQIELASTPGLSNAQILQLLATGSLERSGLGGIGLYLGRGLLGSNSTSNGLLERLTVEVGRDISESGKNTIDLYYQLSEHLRLHGAFDKYDEQTLDLEWEVFSR